MKSILLPVIPNSPLRSGIQTKHGEFQLKAFGSFGFVQNVAFDESLIEYDENYQNDQSRSLKFNRHMETVYATIKSYFPKGSSLVEVGCGKGAFLDIVKKDEYFEYSGYDATYEGSDKRIFSRYLRDGDNLHADMVVLRHTLEHIKHPQSFLAMLKGVFNEDAMIYIEVPQFEWIEKNKTLFDFTYEHVNYFTSKSLCSFFANVIEYGDIFDEQYQFCIARLSSLQLGEWGMFNDPVKWTDYHFDEYVDHFISSFEFLKSESRIWVWGGATKGVLFLKHLKDTGFPIHKNVLSIIDINPSKQGLFAPSTGVPIKSPTALFDECKAGDLVLVMNPAYLDEIQNEISEKVGLEIKVISV